MLFDCNIARFLRSKLLQNVHFLASCLHDSFLFATANISRVLSFAQTSGKACGNYWKYLTKFPSFNVMMRFALF